MIFDQLAQHRRMKHAPKRDPYVLECQIQPMQVGVREADDAIVQSGTDLERLIGASDLKLRGSQQQGRLFSLAVPVPQIPLIWRRRLGVDDFDSLPLDDFWGGDHVMRGVASWYQDSSSVLGPALLRHSVDLISRVAEEVDIWHGQSPLIRNGGRQTSVARATPTEIQAMKRE
ncbi:hypothetical protein LZ31DRAFT_342426 [Colletotrichum somersetense]|nr:hypothetical protein LZ31DRAFT_342426 [Colletotrichum somersetense]